MIHDDLYDEFCRCESELNATELSIDDIPIWEAIRTDVYKRVRINRGDWDEPERKLANPTIADYASFMLLAGRNIFIRNPLIPSESDVICYGYYTRQKEDDGFWWDIYCDPLLNELDSYDELYIEDHHDGRHRTPARTENIKYTDVIKTVSALKRIIGLTDYRLSSNESKQLEAVERKIKSVLDVDVDVESVARENVIKRRAEKPVFVKLIRRVDPDVALIVVRHGKESFIEACKEMGVTVIELQHGILTDYEYSYPTKASGETFPDYMFTWGPFWEQQVDMPIPDDNIIPVGYPYLENKATEYMDLPVRDQVLFISQPDVGSELANIAVDVSKSIDPGTKIVYKLHPKEQDDWESTYSQLLSENVQVVGRDGPGLYHLLSQSHTQVGVFSTALYEGLVFDLSTYIVDLPGASNISDIYNNGPAELVSDARELSSALNSSQQAAFDSEHYFKQNSIQNIKSQLDRIIENR